MILYITGVYGPSIQSDRENFYQQLRYLAPQTDPWLICGDFNATLQSEDRSNPASHWRNSQRFAEIIRSMDLHDMSPQGRRFTWSNSRDEPSFASSIVSWRPLTG